MREEKCLLPFMCGGFTCPVLPTEQVPPRGYVSFNSSEEHPLEGGGLCYRDTPRPSTSGMWRAAAAAAEVRFPSRQGGGEGGRS